MNIHKSHRKTCPDFIVSDFVTNTIKTVPVRIGYRTIRVTLKDDKQDRSPTFFAQTALSVVCRQGCLVDIVDVVVKSAPKNAKLKLLIPVNKLFTREAFFYNTVLVELLEFQEEIGIKEATKFQGVPSLIAATVDEGEEALVLENAGAGWAARYERWVGELPQGHVLTVLREFSRFHGLCLAFTTKEKARVFQGLKGGFLSCFENKQAVKMIQDNVNQALKLFDGEVERRLRKFGEEVESFLNNCLEELPKVNVLVHGDPSDCFLFCYEKTEDCNVASRAKLIDWHLVKMGSPVLDLSLFLFTNCTSEDLCNLQLFLQHYHKTLEEYLTECHCDVNQLFPFEVLLEHWKKYAKFGLALSFLALKLTTTDPNRRPNANNEEVTEGQFVEGFVGPVSEEFVRRVKDIVKYCVDTGLI